MSCSNELPSKIIISSHSCLSNGDVDIIESRDLVVAGEG
jgi:hypothetical protein